MQVVTRKESSAVAILDLDGPLTNTTNVTCVSHSIDKLLQLGVKRILFCMTRVSTLDCGGIGRLLEFRKRIVSAGGCLKLAVLNPRSRVLFELFHLTAILGVHESEPAAVASFFEQSRILEFRPRTLASKALHPPTKATTPVLRQRPVTKRSLGSEPGMDAL